MNSLLNFVDMKQHTFDHIEKDCPRCDGAGYFTKFRHIENGKCFRCKGSGFASYDILLPIESIQKIELIQGCENYHAEVLLTNRRTKCIPIVGGESSIEKLSPETAIDELYLMYHKEHGLFFVRKDLPVDDDACSDDDDYCDAYEYEKRWTDEDICNAAFDGHWDIYAHHFGY